MSAHCSCDAPTEPRLPPGETVLWQGSPHWRRLAPRLFGGRYVAAYFGALLAIGLAGGAGALGMAVVAIGGALCLGLMALFAHGVARSTSYSVTSGRVVIRYGLAVPRTLNLPLGLISSADLAPAPGGTGDIALTLSRRSPLAWWALWPHVRPGSFRRPAPMLRAVPDAAMVGRTIAGALAAAQGTANVLPFTPARPRPQPQRRAA